MLLPTIYTYEDTCVMHHTNTHRHEKKKKLTHREFMKATSVFPCSCIQWGFFILFFLVFFVSNTLREGKKKQDAD